MREGGGGTLFYIVFDHAFGDSEFCDGMSHAEQIRLVAVTRWERVRRRRRESDRVDITFSDQADAGRGTLFDQGGCRGG